MAVLHLAGRYDAHNQRIVGDRSVGLIGRACAGAASVAVIAALLGAITGVAARGAAAATVLTGCNTAANPVQCENLLPGTPQSGWLTSEPGDLTIQGFATDQSVAIGATINFKVATPAASWHMDIVRTGWYQGYGGRIVATVSGLHASSQPACVVDSTKTTGLVDCGNWSVSTSWTAPSNAVSGVYFAHLVRDDTHGDSLIQFEVRNDASHSAVLYQTSDVAREAYNQYGGNSLYTCTVACPPGNPLVYKAAYKVSFNRPNTAAALGSMYSYFDAEFPMVEFLESNGYDVSYISGVDTDRLGASMIEQHKLFMDSGHDEYWSGGQRANVTAARDAGVNLAFFSGNEVFWKTRYENSMDSSSTPYRTLVTYKETHFNAPTDPKDPGTWTGTWRDTRFSPPADAAPENSLTGQLYMVDPPSAFAITVPGTYAGLRLWRNTAVAALSLSQTATLAPNTLGYEWDADVDNGSRPAGEVDLSSTTQTVQNTLLDHYGNSEGPGTATHHLSLYRAASGALVFGSGTVQWAFGLEATGNGTVNRTQQQATVNLFADMGIQPTTLIAQLVATSASSDQTAPTATISSPASGATQANGSTVTVTGTATDSGGGVVAGVEVSTDGGATWHPGTIAAAAASTTWSYKWAVTGTGPTTIEVRASDDSENTGAPTAGLAQTVSCPCQIFSAASAPKLVDSQDPNAAELGVKFTTTTDGWVTGVRFYKASANTGVHVGDLWSSTGQLLATANFAAESASGWQQVTFSQAVHVTAGTVYVASYHTTTGHESEDVGAFSGRTVSSPPLTALESSTDTSATVNVSGPNGVYSYSTNPAFPSSSFQDASYYVDVTFVASGSAPFLVGQSPAPGSTGQAINAPITATFSEGVFPASISFTLTGPAGAVPASFAYNPATQTASVTPQANLATGTTYTASVSGATDSQGRSMSGPITWTFSTFSCPCGLFAPSATPVTTGAGDSSSVELGVKFSPSIAGYVYGLRFYKSAANTGTHVGSLWSATGQLLDQVTFANETASGWEAASFLTPVPVSQGTSYVVSYHTSTGHYAADGAYFGAAGVSNGPLQAPGSGVNGLYTYANGPVFPSQTYNGTNYWVDPAFNVTPPVNTGPPAVAVTSPVNGATGVSTSATESATFNEAVQPSSINASIAGPGGVAVAASTAYNVGARTLTLTPSSPLVAGANYTATVSSAIDLQGQPMTAPYSWSFTTTGVTCPCTLWPASATPAVASANDSSSIEVGTRFSADRSGYVTGIRFYKGAGNSGTHIGDLWSATGTLMATGVFTNETATGWQELDFPNSVAVTAGTGYIVSYHTDTGHYAYTGGYLSVGYDQSPLHAPGGANGVFEVGASGFPNQSYNSTNYWVDAVFNTVAQPPVRSTPPALASRTPASGASAVPTATSVTAVFDEPVVPSSAALTLTNSAGGAIAGSQAYNATTRTVTFTPAAPLANLSSYTASAQATDLAGNADPAPLTWSFTTVAPTCPCTVWSSSTTPGTVDSGDGTALELGVKFHTSLSGYVTGVRFYKSAANTGTHVGNIWTTAGQLLATATFTSESASGWQDVAFATPVAVTAGTTYVASYHTNVGHYSYDGGYFATAGAGSGPVQAPSSASAGGNGVYTVSGTSTYPTSTYNGGNYWVDPVFATASPGTAPAAGVLSPTSGATGVSLATTVSAAINESVLPSLTFGLADSAGHPVSGSVSYDPVTLVATFVPTAALSVSTTYTATLSGLQDLAGDTMTGPSIWSFTTGSS